MTAADAVMDPPAAAAAADRLAAFADAFMREAKTSVQRGLAVDFRAFAAELIGLLRATAREGEP